MVVETGLVVGGIVGAEVGVADEHAAKTSTRKTVMGTMKMRNCLMDTMAPFNGRISQ